MLMTVLSRCGDDDVVEAYCARARGVADVAEPQVTGCGHRRSRRRPRPSPWLGVARRPAATQWTQDPGTTKMPPPPLIEDGSGIVVPPSWDPGDRRVSVYRETAVRLSIRTSRGAFEPPMLMNPKFPAAVCDTPV